MKRFLLVFVCLVGILGSTATFGNSIAIDDKPPITKPLSTEDIS